MSPSIENSACAPPQHSERQQLFRQEAVTYAGSRIYGTVVLAHLPSYARISQVFVGILTMVVIFLALAQTARKVQCQGMLLPNTGIIRVVASQAGTIKARYVSEGQRVLRGQVMFVLSNERSSSVGKESDALIASLLKIRRDSFSAEIQRSSMQSREKMHGIRRELDGLLAEIKHLDEQIAMQRTRVELAENAKLRYVQLYEIKYISAAQYHEKQSETLDQRQKLADLERNKIALKRAFASSESSILDIQAQHHRETESLKRNVAVIEESITENQVRRELLIRAPESGVVTTVMFEMGQHVEQSISMASIMPMDSVLDAEIYVPTRAVGFIRPGMHVLLAYQAFPYQKFGHYRATVTEISDTSLSPQELQHSGTVIGTSEPIYRVRLRLEHQNARAYGKPVALKSGMLLEANIVLEHRRLYEWILEPLLSATGRQL